MSRVLRIPGWTLALAFVVVPLVEIWTIISVGRVIGPWWTIVLLALDSIIGAWLVKHEGLRAWRALNSALASGRMPTAELADGALILIGGTLMLTPGFATDLVGVLLVLPFTRPVARRLLAALISRRLLRMPTTFGPVGPGNISGGAGEYGGFGTARTHREPRNATHPGAGPGPVVQGEVVDP